MKEKMIKFRPILSAAFFSVLLAFSGCSDINNASSVLGIDASADDIKILSDNDGKSDKDTRKENGNSTSGNSGGTTTPASVKDFGDNFIRGFDASAVDYYEQNVDGNGAVIWKDTDGTTKDFFKIIVDHGYDTVRLRIWNDPSKKVDGSLPVGDNTLERTISMAKRIKAAGLKLMLDFHYSDTWADPLKQYVPREWLNATSADDVAAKISAYTTEVLSKLKTQADIVPSYVQIGNEINSGMIRDKTTPNSTKPDFEYPGKDATQIKYLKAAGEAVRAFGSEIKIIVHVTSSNQPESLLNQLKNNSLDYDIIGLSYYPWEKKNNGESAHGTIQQMAANVKNWKTTYGKPVIIAECSAQFAGDSSSDSVAYRKIAAVDMIDSNNNLYSDLATETVNSATCLVGSVANAKAVLRHIMQETYNAEGIGCVAWGGEMHGDWNRAMFDLSGKAMDNIDAFNYKPADGYKTEGDSNTASGDGNSSGASSQETQPYTVTIEELTSGVQKTYTSSGNGDLFIKSDSFTSLNSTGTLTVKAVLKPGSNSTWIGWCKGTDWGGSCEWNSTENAYVATVSVSDVKTTGLGMKSDNGAVYTVTVTYTASSGGDTTGSGTTETVIANSVEFSMTGTKNSKWNSDTALESSRFSSYSSSTVSKIVVSVSFDNSIIWGTSMKIIIGNDWLETGSWSNGVITFTITDAGQISTIISNGVIFGSDYSGKGYATVTVTYTD